MKRRGIVERCRQPIFAAGLAIPLLLSGVACGGGSTASATPSPSGVRESLTYVASGLDATKKGIYVAKIEGFFAAANLDVSLQIIPNVVPVIVAGQADIAGSGSGSAFSLANQGKETSITHATAGNGVSGFLAAAPSISSVAQCTRLVTAQVGSAVNSWAVLYRSLFAAKYTIVNLTNVNEGVPLVISGQADCAVSTITFFAAALAEHKIHLLVDPRIPSTLPKNTPKNLVEGGEWGLSDNLKQKRSAVVKFMRAVIRADALIKRSTTAQVATILRKDPAWQPFTQDQLVQLLDQTNTQYEPAGGNISSDGWIAMRDFFINGGLTFMNRTDPEWMYAKRVDMSYFKAASGG